MIKQVITSDGYRIELKCSDRRSQNIYWVEQYDNVSGVRLNVWEFGVDYLQGLNHFKQLTR
jgi:hypothetical protein